MKTTIDNYPLKPRTGSTYSYAWRVLKKYFIPLFLTLIITTVAGSPLGIFGDFNAHHGNITVFSNVFSLAYALFVLIPIHYGASYLYLRASRGEQFEVREIFDVFKNFLNVLLAGLLSGAIIGIGFIFLIVPGIVFACRLAFVPYLVMDQKLDPVKAVEESWRLTRGYGWRIFGMSLLAIPIALGGILVLFFGIIVAAIWIDLAFASMYHAVMLERREYLEESISEYTDESAAE